MIANIQEMEQLVEWAIRSVSLRSLGHYLVRSARITLIWGLDTGIFNFAMEGVWFGVSCQYPYGLLFGPRDLTSDVRESNLARIQAVQAWLPSLLS